MNARSRVHEYGGGQTVPVGNSGDTITSDFSTNALIYTQCDGDVSTQGVTLSGQGPYRYADMSLDPLQSRGGSRLLVAVREDHTVDEPAHVVNSIVILSVDDTSRVSQGSYHGAYVSCPASSCVLITGGTRGGCAGELRGGPQHHVQQPQNGSIWHFLVLGAVEAPRYGRQIS